MLGRTVNTRTVKSGDFTWPFKNVDEELARADVTFINLESPFANDCPRVDSGMIFCADLRSIEGLLNSGVDIASLANNHAMNYGINGVNTSKSVLERNGVEMVGYENPKYIQVNNVKVGLLGYDDVECYGNGVACAVDSQIIADILKAKDNSDLVIIMYSWGAEYRDYPTERQIELAHLSIDAGADLILGNHPHWYQPVEIYKDKLVIYSHGNFIFDQMWSERTKEGIVGEYIFIENELIDVKFRPVYIENYGQPMFVEGVHKEKILKHFTDISYEFAELVEK